MSLTGNDKVDYPYGVMYTVHLTILFDGYRGGYPLVTPFAEKDNDAAIAFARETLQNELAREGVVDITDAMVMRYDPDSQGVHKHTIVWAGQSYQLAGIPRTAISTGNADHKLHLVPPRFS